jgi:hypothetical protein
MSTHADLEPAPQPRRVRLTSRGKDDAEMTR